MRNPAERTLTTVANSVRLENYIIFRLLVDARDSMLSLKSEYTSITSRTCWVKMLILECFALMEVCFLRARSSLKQP